MKSVYKYILSSIMICFAMVSQAQVMCMRLEMEDSLGNIVTKDFPLDELQNVSFFGKNNVKDGDYISCSAITQEYGYVSIDVDVQSYIAGIPGNIFLCISDQENFDPKGDCIVTPSTDFPLTSLSEGYYLYDINGRRNHLDVNTKYYYRAYIDIAGVGRFYSKEECFTTLTPSEYFDSFINIINLMQPVITSSILLGEARADLVSVEESASADLKSLADNNVGAGNAYNRPSDYYRVINACNAFLKETHEQTTTALNAEIAVKCYRAWCYLELAKIYGEIPFSFTPVNDAENLVAAFRQAGSVSDVSAVTSSLINDLKDYANLYANNFLLADLHTLVKGVTTERFCIPVRLMLAELYLWRGSFNQSKEDFVNAVKMYHDYMMWENEEKRLSTGDYEAYWYNSNTKNSGSCRVQYYNKSFKYDDPTTLYMLPLDATELINTFSSTAANSYHPSLLPSGILKSISRNQTYHTNAGALPHDASEYFNPLAEGDLRLISVYRTVREGINFVSKYQGGEYSRVVESSLDFLPLMRNSIVYLHLAEALNGAGYPETAFAVLSCGLNEQTISDNVVQCAISPIEYEGLKQMGADTWLLAGGIHSLGCGSTIDYFLPTDYDTYASEMLQEPEPVANPGPQPAKPVDYVLDFDTWMELYHPGQSSSRYQNVYNNYVKAHNDSVAHYEYWLEAKAAYDAYTEAIIPIVTHNRNVFSSHEDIVQKRQAVLDLMILEEEALEGMFEGRRYYDLMRWGMRNGQFKSTSATIQMPDYYNLPTNSGYVEFLKRDFKPSDSKMQGKPWFITLQ